MVPTVNQAKSNAADISFIVDRLFGLFVTENINCRFLFYGWSQLLSLPAVEPWLTIDVVERVDLA